ncbi:MAG: hypothetical protein QUS09_01485 [Methanotrichaceae archaeon]|nr:hypothetical protein [Methanotrichaceae archaeon]
MMRRKYIAIVLLFSIAFAAESLPALGQGVSSEEASRLILNVYLDGTGKALVTGYAEDPDGLPFLNSSQYSYENETGQLYALTNALTRKDGDTWTLTFRSPGYYEDYRVTFYLPSDFKVKNVSSSQGLEHILSASNDSLALDFQGYDVQDPIASIEYQQPLEASVPPNFRPPDLLLLLLVLTVAVGAVAAVGWRYMVRRPPQPGPFTDNIEKPEEVADVTAGAGTKPSSTTSEGVENPSEMAAEADIPTETPVPLKPPSEQAQPFEDDLSSEQGRADEVDEEKQARTEADVPLSKAPAEKIEISSEMAAVMETLTPRERAILQALIDRGGRSTQADLRYETRTPKSSLTGIIYSLERRKLVIKKEWGRTNVIELSDWFLSKKERS